MALSESMFHRVADQALNEIALAIETQLDDRVEVEQEEGVVIIDLENGGRIQINKHGTAREIWLASPTSGGWHFACEGPGHSWVSTRNPGVTLGGLLRDELGAATGVYVELNL